MLLPLLGMGPKVKEGERGGRSGFVANRLVLPLPGWPTCTGAWGPCGDSEVRSLQSRKGSELSSGFGVLRHMLPFLDPLGRAGDRVGALSVPESVSCVYSWREVSGIAFVQPVRFPCWKDAKASRCQKVHSVCTHGTDLLEMVIYMMLTLLLERQALRRWNPSDAFQQHGRSRMC